MPHRDRVTRVVPCDAPVFRRRAAPKFTCACCGHRTLPDFPGSFSCCPVCFWEDDSVQLLDPTYRGGANSPSLIECQANFASMGACCEGDLAHVRPPRDDEPLDPAWRRATPDDVHAWQVPRTLSDDERARLETWHYWLRRPLRRT